MTAASEEARLIASDVETLRLHYAYTLRDWLARTPRQPRGDRRDVRRALLRMWEFYLAGGVVRFENGAMCNYQVQYVRDRRALPITRDYMVEDERRYRAMDDRPARPSPARRGGARAKASA